MLLDERHEQRADLLRLFLLHPVTRAVEQVSPDHPCAAGALHPLETARHLIGAPVALPRDVYGRNVDRAAGEEL